VAVVRVDIDLYGDELVSRKLLRWSGEVVGNMSPVWDAVEDHLATCFERNFAQQGPAWAPLKASTIRSRIAQGYPPGPILTRSGEYRKALTTELTTHTTDSEMTVVAPAVPGAFHQAGTSRMAARPMRLTENEKRETVKIIQRYLIEEMI
jgi:phage gpG-like protein